MVILRKKEESALSFKLTLSYKVAKSFYKVNKYYTTNFSNLWEAALTPSLITEDSISCFFRVAIGLTLRPTS